MCVCLLDLFFVLFNKVVSWVDQVFNTQLIIFDCILFI